jgi:hypothetical protein
MVTAQPTPSAYLRVTTIDDVTVTRGTLLLDPYVSSASTTATRIMEDVDQTLTVFIQDQVPAHVPARLDTHLHIK